MRAAEALSCGSDGIRATIVANTPRLSRGEVHLWQTHIDRTKEYSSAGLSPDEVDRANKTAIKQKRNAFIAARGFLREVLGAYLDIAPYEVEFIRSELGKPALRNIPSQGPVYFNISYSMEAVLVGISMVAELGVDIEYMRDELSFDDIAKNFYSPGEKERLMHFSAMERKKKFYECWTIKEAFIKALGVGLRMPLDSFEVDFVSGEGASLSSYDGAVDISPCFTLKKLNPRSGYAGAVAVNGEVSALKSFQVG